MAKVTAPLFSATASGTVGRKLTYRNTQQGAVVQRPAIPSKPATFAQGAERTRFTAAMAAWAALGSTPRGEWQAAAAHWSMRADMLFTREYLLQQVTGSALPLIPSII